MAGGRRSSLDKGSATAGLVNEAYGDVKKVADNLTDITKIADNLTSLSTFSVTVETGVGNGTIEGDTNATSWAGHEHASTSISTALEVKATESVVIVYAGVVYSYLGNVPTLLGIGGTATISADFGIIAVANHATLSSRTLPDQHPIAAISGLQVTLDAKAVPDGDTFTNTILTAPTIASPVLNGDLSLGDAVLNDTTLAADSVTKIPTQHAVKVYTNTEIVSKAFHFPTGDTALTNIADLATRQGKYLGFDGAGNFTYTAGTFSADAAGTTVQDLGDNFTSGNVEGVLRDIGNDIRNVKLIRNDNFERGVEDWTLDPTNTAVLQVVNVGTGEGKQALKVSGATSGEFAILTSEIFNVRSNVSYVIEYFAQAPTVAVLVDVTLTRYNSVDVLIDTVVLNTAALASSSPDKTIQIVAETIIGAAERISVTLKFYSGAPTWETTVGSINFVPQMAADSIEYTNGALITTVASELISLAKVSRGTSVIAPSATPIFDTTRAIQTLNVAGLPTITPTAVISNGSRSIVEFINDTDVPCALILNAAWKIIGNVPSNIPMRSIVTVELFWELSVLRMVYVGTASTITGNNNSGEGELLAIYDNPASGNFELELINLFTGTTVLHDSNPVNIDKYAYYDIVCANLIPREGAAPHTTTIELGLSSDSGASYANNLVILSLIPGLNGSDLATVRIHAPYTLTSTLVLHTETRLSIPVGTQEDIIPGSIINTMRIRAVDSSSGVLTGVPIFNGKIYVYGVHKS